jgi:hypothetical protein
MSNAMTTAAHHASADGLAGAIQQIAIKKTEAEAAQAEKVANNDLTAYDENGEVDPEQTLANITQKDYDDYLENVKPLEMELLNKAKTDTSLIDQAREDRGTSNALMQGIVDRNASRYGATLTPAQIQAQKTALSTGTTLAGIQGVNDARVAQKDSNRALMQDLIDIGQGVQRASLSSLGNAAASAAQRESAYKNARAQHKAQTYNMLGSIAGAALTAVFMGA